MAHEDTLRIVEQHWDREVEAGCALTAPDGHRMEVPYPAHSAGENT